MTLSGIHSTNTEIMTLAEVAEYLKISEKSVTRMAKKGEIPVTKVASQWRFMRTVIDDWLISRMDLSPESDISGLIKKDEIPLYLSRLIKPEDIILNLIPGNKKSILKQLIQPLIINNRITDSNLYLSLLMDREDMVSTGIGNSIAIPHIRNPNQYPVTPCIITGICKNGTSFDSLDNKNANIFFLICSDSEVVHLKIMAKLVTHTRNTTLIKELLACENEKDIISKIIEYEQ